jgi:(1->4)-alpha-D-glucan 1-alpha-D-glucosylmutase
MSPADDLLHKTSERLAAGRPFPESTYRLQFHSGFTFRDATAILPYLADLGVTHCYSSPYLQARPGSQHGYDITNHGALNPEVGSEEDYAAWVADLQARGLGQILDTVPNHMGVAGNDNAWWNDVLENGPASPYAGYFDIAWRDSPRPQLRDRILLPVLGDPYGAALEAQQLRLSHSAGSFTIHYFDRVFPVEPGSYKLILSRCALELGQSLAADAPALVEFQSILTAISHLPPTDETAPAAVAERQREKDVIKRRLGTLTQESAPVRDAIEKTVALFNGRAGDAHSFDLLDELLDAQAYRLSYWRVASDEINYRRFFDINELAALSMEKPEVFAATHELILRLLREGKVNGLRIDHPDGLYDPRQYLERLQQHYLLDCAQDVFESDPEFRGLEWKDLEGELLEKWATRGASRGDDSRSESSTFRPLYVVVEKILGPGEPLPEDWPIHGTSGYHFLNVINGLFLDPEGDKPLTRAYREWTGLDDPFAEIVYQKKLLILQVSLSSELQMLAHQLDRLAQKNRWSRDYTLNSLRYALQQIIACFPVYRSYISDTGVHDSDRKYVEQAVRRAMLRNPTVSRGLFRFVRDMILLRYPESAPLRPDDLSSGRRSSEEDDRAEQRRFAGKFQQVTAPVMAKGMEDTAFYVYNRLLSLNEVAGDPGKFGTPPEVAHRYFTERQARWPWSMSPLSTHDTKRGEDVRARLNVLSELPGEWRDAVDRWSRLNERHRPVVDEAPVPDANEEYFLYQTLVGAWPLELYGSEEYAQFVQRIQDYMHKALHEAKVHTSWINPDDEYDTAIQEFVARILDEKGNAPFLQDFRTFQKRISHFGLFNSLAQTLLKFTSPGVPDTYQGTELWDFSLVDPDNRRPVDYQRRQQLLRGLQGRVAEAGPDRRELARELARSREDGRIKLYVTWQGLRCLREHPGLFTTGEYLPVTTTGPGQDHVFSFVRRQGDEMALVVVPRLLTRLPESPDGLPLDEQVWQDTALVLPEAVAGRRWQNVFTSEEVSSAGGQGEVTLPVREVFAHFPVALLLAKS